VKMVAKGMKIAADAALLFNVDRSTISRLLARAGSGRDGKRSSVSRPLVPQLIWQSGSPNFANNTDKSQCSQNIVGHINFPPV
jgi:hypothetical protein